MREYSVSILVPEALCTEIFVISVFISSEKSNATDFFYALTNAAFRGVLVLRNPWRWGDVWSNKPRKN
jgi:hypothetical protein